MKIVKTKDVKTPSRGTGKSAGLDFYIPNDFPGTHYLAPLQDVCIDSGIIANVPEGFALIGMNKSGQALKKGLQLGACVVDEDYQEEIKMHVRNISNDVVEIEPGEKLIQMLLLQVDYRDVEVVDKLEDLFTSESDRKGGFGSTGTE